jgi:hypothetical protein|tara:strand:- start:31 stop:582 length:552 start_codon:yes stop_codon:yes gene_type:complete
MQIFKQASVVTVAIMFFYSSINAQEATTIGDVEMPAIESSDAFNEMRNKLGKWQGEMTQELTGETFNVSYEWRITSGGNTITETIIEDGVEMLTTYNDDNGKLVVKHYCALGTEPVFMVTQATDNVIAISFDESRSDLQAEHHNFVESMKWTTDSMNPNVMVFENVVILDGERTNNRAVLSKL